MHFLLVKWYILRFSARCIVQNQFSVMASIYLRRSTGFVRLVFFTSSKAIYFSGHLFDLIQSLLSNRVLKIALNGHYSRSFFINVGLTSTHGPNLFLIFITDVFHAIIFRLTIYDDDTTIYSWRNSESDRFNEIYISKMTSVCC